MNIKTTTIQTNPTCKEFDFIGLIDQTISLQKPMSSFIGKIIMFQGMPWNE